MMTEKTAPGAMARWPQPPFPDGWYLVELSENLPPGKLFGRQWLGRANRCLARGLWRRRGSGFGITARRNFISGGWVAYERTASQKSAKSRSAIGSSRRRWMASASKPLLSRASSQKNLPRGTPGSGVCPAHDHARERCSVRAGHRDLESPVLPRTSEAVRHRWRCLQGAPLVRSVLRAAGRRLTVRPASTVDAAMPQGTDS